MLGLDQTATARKLARLLLADPLGERESWEEQLEKAGDEEGGSLLIRFVWFS